jgi:hypothetical protein
MIIVCCNHMEMVHFFLQCVILQQNYRAYADNIWKESAGTQYHPHLSWHM